MGLVQGDLRHRHLVVPHRVGRHRLQLHVADLPPLPRRQHDRPLEVRVHAQLVNPIIQPLDIKTHFQGKIDVLVVKY